MVIKGQEFKNYKELCLYLGEEIKTGKSKELQLKRWQLSFAFHKEGYKIVIDEVKEQDIVKSDGRGGNRKHVKAFMPYVIYCLVQSGIDDEYVSKQRMMKSELKLIPSEIYKMFNRRGENHTEELAKMGVSSYENFRMFVHYFETYAGETLKRCLDELQREKVVVWNPGQVFIVGLSKKRTVYTIGYEEVIKDIETKVCNEMNKRIKNEDLKGRQLLHVIKRDEKLTKEFYKRCVELLTRDRELMKGIKKKYEKEYGQEFVPEMVKDYYSVYYIGSVDYWKLKFWKIDGIDGVRLRKAFSDPAEVKMLKDRVYVDIFNRMRKAMKKSGVGNEDFERLKMLIKRSD